MKTSESINELAAALAKAQAKVEGAHKSSANPFFKSKYADLASVWDACREPLTSNGLSVVQFPLTEIVQFKGIDDKGKEFDGSYAKVSVATRLIHSSGQWIEGEVAAEAKDAGPQAIGSAITYLRRYALQSVIGIAPEDDDGNAASKPGERPVQRTATQTNGKHDSAATPEYAAFEGYLRSLIGSHSDVFPSMGDAWKAIKGDCDRQGLSTAAALKGCSDPEKFNALKSAIEAKIPVPF